MPLIDDDGRLLGRVNLFDAAIAAFVLMLIPIAYGTFLLFRTPAPRISSVVRVPITQEERRVAGGNRLTAKLKVHGSGMRPMLQASRSKPNTEAALPPVIAAASTSVRPRNNSRNTSCERGYVLSGCG